MGGAAGARSSKSRGVQLVEVRARDRGTLRPRRTRDGGFVLKVLHVGKYYPPVPGGMERVVQMLCEVTRGRLDSRVLAFHRSASTLEEVVGGVPVTRVGTLGQA